MCESQAASIREVRNLRWPERSGSEGGKGVGRPPLGVLAVPHLSTLLLAPWLLGLVIRARRCSRLRRSCRQSKGTPLRVCRAACQPRAARTLWLHRTRPCLTCGLTSTRIVLGGGPRPLGCLRPVAVLLLALLLPAWAARYFLALLGVHQIRPPSRWWRHGGLRIAEGPQTRLRLRSVVQRCPLGPVGEDDKVAGS